MKNEKIRTGTIAILTVVLVITGAVMIPRIHQEGGEGKDSRTENQVAGEAEEKDGTFRSLGEPDQQTAAIYAELYETPQEEVAALYRQTGDWEKTGETLEKQFFTIPENTKYQMEEDGYSPEDIEEAEKLSVKTGIKATELIQAKGKTGDNKSWADVKKEKGIGEEQETDAE